MQLPSYAVTTKKFNYLLVKTGTLMLKVLSDLRGYIPGQVIKLATEIHNKSGKDTGYVLASLIQVSKDLNVSFVNYTGQTLKSSLFVFVHPESDL